MLCMALTACYEDGDYAALSLWGVVADHENRLTALEEWQEQANSDIAALQQLVNATTADYITGVTPVMQGGEQVGYTITFLHAAPITIYHGKQGGQGEDGTKSTTLSVPMALTAKKAWRGSRVPRVAARRRLSWLPGRALPAKALLPMPMGRLLCPTAST